MNNIKELINLPLTISQTPDINGFQMIYASGLRPFAIIKPSHDGVEKFILTACNNHFALVENLERSKILLALFLETFATRISGPLYEDFRNNIQKRIDLINTLLDQLTED